MTERPTCEICGLVDDHSMSCPRYNEWIELCNLRAKVRALEQELAALKIEHNGPCDSYGLCLQCAARLDSNTDLLKALTLAQAELKNLKAIIDTAADKCVYCGDSEARTQRLEAELAASKERITETEKNWAKTLEDFAGVEADVMALTEALMEITEWASPYSQMTPAGDLVSRECLEDRLADCLRTATAALSTPATAPQKAGE